MTKRQLAGLRALEGRHVSLSLTNGSRIDDCDLVSVGRSGLGTAWIFANGADHFVPIADLADVWESSSR